MYGGQQAFALWQARPSGLVVHLLCAAILFVAAGFKVHGLLTDSTGGTLFGPWWLELLLVAYEPLLAGWLVCGVHRERCRKVALVTFGSFATYALYLALSGAASCGCFGRAHVSPWWTLLLDVAAAALLLSQSDKDWEAGATRLLHPRRALVARSIAALAVAGVVVVGAHGISTLGDDSVRLEPGEWVGQRFPLLGEIDVGNVISRGPWIVLLVREGCPTCDDAIGRYEKLALRNSKSGRGARIAVVQFPPHSATRRETTGGSDVYVAGRMSARRTWLVTTPTEITLRDGIVRNVREIAAGLDEPLAIGL